MQVVVENLVLEQVVLEKVAAEKWVLVQFVFVQVVLEKLVLFLVRVGHCWEQQHKPFLAKGWKQVLFQEEVK